MKLLKVIIVFLLTISIYSQNKNGYAIYTKSVEIDYGLNDTIKPSKTIIPKKLEYLKYIENEVPKFEYKLQFSNKTAKYFQVEKMDVEDENTIAINLAKAALGIKGEYFYDITNKSLFHKFNSFGDVLLVEKESNEFNWILIDEKKLIGNVVCFKAKTTKIIDRTNETKSIEVIAWYAPSITLQIGPDGYFGLPGLIIQIKDRNITTTLKKLKFNDKKNEIIIPSKGKKMSEAEYRKYIREIIPESRK